MTESISHITAEQIEEALPALTDEELNKIGRALARDASRRIREKSR